MRSILIIIHISIAYFLLRGWEDAPSIWLRAALALIVIMLAIPYRESKKFKGKPVIKRTLLNSLRKPQWIDFLYIGAVIVSVELLLLSVFALFPREAETLATNLHQWVLSSEQDPEQAPEELSHSGNGNWLWDNHSQRPLSGKSIKRPSNKPDIFIDLLTPEATEQIKKTQIYVKSFSLDYFDGQSWSINKPMKLMIKSEEKKAITIRNNQLTNPPILNLAPFPVFNCRVTQTYHNNGQNVFCALHNPLSTTISSLTKVSSDTYMLPALGPENISYNYNAKSQPININDLLATNTPIIPATIAEIDSVYFSQANDPQLQQKVTALADTISADQSKAAILRQIRDLVRTRASYSLEITNTGNHKALDNFLFHERRGYCEHFATATAMLCREHGIPSRISYGWTGGKHFKKSNLFVFLAKNAHAWTEIHLKDIGWVIFDTTPESDIQRNESSKDLPPLDDNNEISFTVLTQQLADYEQKQRSSTWQIPALIILSGTLLTSVILIFRKNSGSSTISHTSSHLPSTPPKYLPLFEKLCAKHGKPYHAGTTLSQNIDQLKLVTTTEEAPMLDQLLEYHYGITYRNEPINKATESDLLKSIKQAISRADQMQAEDTE